jgi:hypothetical protein
MGVKRPGREADHSPPTSAESKNAWMYTSIPRYFFMAWCLVKHRDILSNLYAKLQCLLLIDWFDHLIVQFQKLHGTNAMGKIMMNTE